MQLLGSNASTGVLRITGKYSQDPGLIYFIKGNPVNASTGSLSGIDAVNMLFGWVDGEFEFVEESVTSENIIHKSRMEIILDGLSMLDDGHIEKLGPVSFERDSSDMPVIRGPLVDYTFVLDEEEIHKGNTIVKEGKHGTWFWVILGGMAEIIKETPKGPLRMLKIGEGAFIGSVSSLLFEGGVRGATAVAMDNVQLGVLDSQRLDAEFSSMSEQFKNLVVSLDKRLKEVTDRAVDIKLQQEMLEKYMKGKKRLIKQGNSDERIFTITEGEAYIVRQTESGYVPLANLHIGDFFGQVPFFDIGHEPFSASVFGSDNLKVSKMDTDSLQEEYQKLSPTFRNIIEHLATCVSVTTMLACDYKKKTIKKKSGKA
jgi:CRP-like cAMP-binding protein